MVLNIFPRRKDSDRTESPAPAVALPEPAPEVLAEAEARAPRRRTRAPAARAVEASEQVAFAEPGTSDASAAGEAEKPAPRRRRGARPKADEETVSAVALEVIEETAAPTPEEPGPDPGEETEAPARSRRRRGRGGGGGARDGAPPASETAPAHAPGAAGDGAILRAIEQQSRQIEQLIRLQEDNMRRGGGGSASAPPARVGVFVDAANIELASDRMRTRFDWKKILDLLTRDRQLVRAIAYSPIHDDPGVSIETQRFVEPFLDKGYKVVTKPLRRFQDGTIKANVDIELALDVMEMLDRLDVVCLVSGDGDFQRLVEVVQGKGVRAEVVAVGSSTAANLRHAADHYIDLQARVRDVRV